MIEANKTFYNAMCWLSGLFLGVAHFQILIAPAEINWLVYAFYIAPVIPPYFLIQGKWRTRGQLQVALERPEFHIVSDCLVFMAFGSTLAILTYSMTSNNPLTLFSAVPTRHQVLLIFNFSTFIMGMIGLRYFAKKERDELRKKNEQNIWA